jgi:hypothetical protein
MATGPILGVVLGLRAALAGRFRLPPNGGVPSNAVELMGPARVLRGSGLRVFRQ